MLLQHSELGEMSVLCGNLDGRVLQVDHLHFYLQGAWVPPACPHFPQPSSLIVHSVVFHPLRVKFRGVVTLCDISYSWCLRTQP